MLRRGVATVHGGVHVRLRRRWATIYGDDVDPWSQRFLRDHALPNTTAIDVGAGPGLHTCLLSRYVGHSGRVFAFERTDVVASLRDTVELNRATNVVIGDALPRLDDDIPEIDDTIRRRVTVVRIDVAGDEVQVLEGATVLLDRWRPALALSIRDASALEILDALGYDVVSRRGPLTAADLGRGDVAAHAVTR